MDLPGSLLNIRLFQITTVGLYLFVSINLQSTTVAGETDWLYDNAPGIAMEYKVHIDPGKEDCYWQFVHAGATIYMNMQVLKGGDGMAGMAVKNPQNEVVHPYEWKQNAEYEETAQTGGYYCVCIDNQFSRFAGKLINLYITTFRNDLWEKYTKELEDLDVSVNNFTESIRNVDKNIHDMLQYQSSTRAREVRDHELMMDNRFYIQYWSIAQCIAILAASTLQVFSVRKLFNDNDTRKTKSGARA